jgi:hypothetical protein
VHVTVTAAGVPEPVKPNVVVAPAASEPFQEAFLTVTVEPLVVYVPLQSWVTCSPLVKVHLAVQPEIAAGPAFTVTVLWKPPDQELTTAEEALQAPAGAVVGAVVGGVVGPVVGGVVGEVVGGEVGGVVGDVLPSLVV